MTELRSMPERHIKLTILATKAHCSEDCIGQGVIDVKYCTMFAQYREWDPAREYDGFKRLPACRTAEANMRKEQK